MRKHGQLYADVPLGTVIGSRRRTPTGDCSIASCDRPASKRTWCDTHYNRWVTSGSPNEQLPVRAPYSEPEACSVSSCDLPAAVRGRCQAHEARFRRHGDVQEHLPLRPDSAPPLCKVEGCERGAISRGWCSPHYSRWRKKGDVQADVPVGGSKGASDRTAVDF